MYLELIDTWIVGFTVAIELCLANLNIIKWNDTEGCEECENDLEECEECESDFRLVERVSNEWREFGRLLEIDENILDAWNVQYQGDAKYCWDKVMQQWLDNGSKEYPRVTWWELYEMLEDAGYAEVAKELRKAVRHAVPHKNYCS